MLWEAEYQCDLEKEVQTHIFSARVLGCFDSRNYALDACQYWGEEKIRGNAHAAKERRGTRRWTHTHVH